VQASLCGLRLTPWCRNSIAVLHEASWEPLSDAFSQARVHIQSRNQSELESVCSCITTPELQDMQGNTLLHVACQNGNKKALKFLLKWGCNMSATNRNRNTPLHYCYAYKYTGLAEYLESKGADTNIMNAHGLFPSQCLVSGLRPAVAPLMQKENVDSNLQDGVLHANFAKAAAMQKEEENKALRAEIAAMRKERRQFGDVSRFPHQRDMNVPEQHRALSEREHNPCEVMHACPPPAAAAKKCRRGRGVQADNIGTEPGANSKPTTVVVAPQYSPAPQPRPPQQAPREHLWRTVKEDAREPHRFAEDDGHMPEINPIIAMARQMVQ